MNYVNCSQVAEKPELLAGWFAFVDDKAPVENLKELADELIDRVMQNGHALWLNPETDGRRVGANAFNAPLTLNGRRLTYRRPVEGAIFPPRG